MASDLGDAILKFSTENKDLEKGTSKAQKTVENLHKSISKPKEGDGLFKKLGSGIGSSIGMGMGIGVGMKIVDGLGSVISKAFERIPELDKIGKIASNSIGIDASTFSGIVGLGKTIGVELADVSEAFVNLAERSKDTGGDIAATFEKMGISQAEFSKLDPGEQFFQLFDALNKLGSPMEKTIALSQLMGEEAAKKLAPLLGKTSAEIRNMSAAYAKSNTDIAAATLANEAMVKANAALESAFDSVVIALTPAFEFLADLIPMAITELSPLFSGFGNIVLPVMKAISKAIAYVWDVVKVGASIINFVVGVYIEGFGLLLKGLGEVVKLAKELPEELQPPGLDSLISGIDSASKAVEGFGKDMQDASAKAFVDAIDHFGESADQIDAFFTAFENRRERAIRETAAKLGKIDANGNSVTKPGMSGTAGIAIEAGSAEAAALSARYQFGSDTLLQKQLDEQKKANAKADKLIEAVQKGLNFGVF